jgi:hypothetical protein
MARTEPAPTPNLAVLLSKLAYPSYPEYSLNEFNSERCSQPHCSTPSRAPSLIFTAVFYSNTVSSGLDHFPGVRPQVRLGWTPVEVSNLISHAGSEIRARGTGDAWPRKRHSQLQSKRETWEGLAALDKAGWHGQQTGGRGTWRAWLAFLPRSTNRSRQT